MVELSSDEKRQFFDVFISYGRADSKVLATKLNNSLIGRGYEVWFDQEDIPPAVDWQNQIDDGIEKSHNFIFIIAPHSVKSIYCHKEIKLAVKYNKRIIPLLHVNSDHCWSQMPEDIRKIIQKTNWIFFVEENNNFEESLTKLLETIELETDYVQKHTELLVKGLEWSRNNKQTNYLLVGEERSQAHEWLKRKFNDSQHPCPPTDWHSEYICESNKNANNLMSEVFLAASEKDFNIKAKIGQTLMREGITIWTDQADLKTGVEFQSEINRGVEGADNFVYLISPYALKSEYCQQELALALKYNKRIIPLLIQPTDLDEIPPHLRALQFIDLTGYEDELKYYEGVKKLLKELNEDKSYYEYHKILLVKALKWQEQNKNPSLLLRGYNLEHMSAWFKVASERSQHQPIALHQEFIEASHNRPIDESLEVFISYSRADSDFTRKLNDALQELGKTTWFDQESIALGEDFEKEIKRGIENCDNFLFVISPRSVNSPYCADEVEYAEKLNKRFITTILHKEVSSKELHPALAKIQWIDFKRYGGDFSANFNELVRTLDTDREHLRNHTKWGQRAREWKNSAQSADLLLRGSEFTTAQEWLSEVLEKKLQPQPTTLCKEFIYSSQKAIEIAKQKERQRQEEILHLQQERAKKAEELLTQREKSAKRQKLFLAVTTGVAAIAIISLINTYKLSQQVKIEKLQEFFLLSNYLFKPDPNWKDLSERIDEVQYWKKENNAPEARQKPLNALLQVAYNIKDNNGEGILSKKELCDPKNKELFAHKNEVRRIAFSPKGQTIASASLDHTVKLWKFDGNSYSLLQTLDQTVQGHQGKVFDVAFSLDGQTIASASSDYTVKLWKLKGTKYTFHQKLEGHQNDVYSVAFSPDGQTIASASLDHTVKLWKLNGNSYSLLQTLDQTVQGHQGGVFGVAFSPDGQTIASASLDHTVKLWKFDGNSYTYARTLKGHKDVVYDVAFSPDGKTIASASSDATVKLWKLDGELEKTITMPNNFRVYQVAFYPQSKDKDWEIIAVASEDKTVKIFNFEGLLVATLFGHKNRVQGVAFSPDGEKIASASGDYRVIIWDLELDIERLLTRSCSWLRQYLKDTPNQGQSDKGYRLPLSCRSKKILLLKH
ncbi:MAG: TIR domain-containing protein [Prochloraceae cyanobacterium]|nr:TIR domain-containing protein [Prochloraceae cyanobacterium]